MEGSAALEAAAAKQPEFWDVEERSEEILADGDPLETLVGAVDFERFRPILERAAGTPPGLKGGRPALNIVPEFRMLVLLSLRGLSLATTEAMARDRPGWMRFDGIELRDKVLDANTLRDFREALIKAVREGPEAFGSAAGKRQPKLGPWIGDLERMLAERAALPRRERPTLTRIHEDPASPGQLRGGLRFSPAAGGGGAPGGACSAGVRSGGGLPVRLEHRGRMRPLGIRLPKGVKKGCRQGVKKGSWTPPTTA